MLAARRDSAPPIDPTHRSRMLDRRLFSGAFSGLLVINVCLGFFFGSVQIAITALALERGIPQLTGLILSATSVVSLASGVVYGSRRWPGSARAVLVTVSLFLAVMTAAAAVIRMPLGTFLAIALAGAAIAPIIATCNTLIQRTVPAPMLTQAFTWTNSASAAGIACAAALVGASIEHGGSAAGFITTALLVATTPVAAALAWLDNRRQLS